MNDEARFEALRARLAELTSRSPALARQLGGLDLGELRGPEDLARIPDLRKSALAARQSAEPPFGPLAAAPTSAFPRLFASPGGIYEPESAGRDPWRAPKAFDAVGVVAGEIVVNCFSYHLTPGGRILEAGAIALGCPVIPAGPGNTEQLIAAIAHLKPSIYCGPPDFLKIVLDKARATGADVSSLKKALVSGAALPASLRAELEGQEQSKRVRLTPLRTSESSPTRPMAITGLSCPACSSTTTSSSRSRLRAPTNSPRPTRSVKSSRQSFRATIRSFASRPATSRLGPRLAALKVGWARRSVD
jgi:phenylacetate-coenzyme A ligase PaaK-like adenylate-forming protein